ncbi:MAG: aminopeptidase P family protein [Anaerolineaceae bacterium]|nr:MAG: aminopeptidase P family protein [Anaerolineaceae bacterium]
MSFNYIARNQRMADRLESADVVAVALVPGANMRYFTGVAMHPSERPTVVLLGADKRAVIVPQLEMPVWESACRELDIEPFVWTDAGGFASAFKAAVAALGCDGCRLGVDGREMRVFEYLALEATGAALIDVAADLLAIRAIKTPEEVDAIRRAIDISQRALERTIDAIRPGLSERTIADKLERHLREMGAEGLAFETLVQTGVNSAVPHGHVSERIWRAGELLLIDFGGLWAGYPADITRTFCAGEPDVTTGDIYRTVLEANRAAIAQCAPGRKAGEIDRAAREVIERAGYGQYFTHRTGHGMGLAVHEQPDIAPDNDTILQAGMVFTIEPGIYLPHLGGVRIEDNILITPDGAEVLTNYPKGNFSL